MTKHTHTVTTAEVFATANNAFIITTLLSHVYVIIVSSLRINPVNYLCYGKDL